MVDARGTRDIARDVTTKTLLTRCSGVSPIASRRGDGRAHPAMFTDASRTLANCHNSVWTASIE